MKHTSLWVVLIGASAWVSELPLSASVIAYWDFSSDSNGVTDVSGNCHSLTNSGVVISNGVAVFDGGQGAFSTVSKLDLTGNNNLTVEFFMRTTSTNLMAIVEQTTTFNNNPGAFFFDANDGAKGRVIGGFRTSAGYNLDQTPTGAGTDGQWHHVAVVYSASKTGADRSMLYFDGVAQSAFNNLTNDALTYLRNDTLFIGSRANSTLRYIGELDDLRISNTALETNQFLQARSAGTPPVIAHWRFDDGAALADSSGNGNTLTGSGVVFTNGIARFAGAQALNTAATLNLAAYTNLTVEFFLRASAASPSMIVLEQTSQFFSNPGAFLVSLNETNSAGQVMGGFCTASGTKLNLDITAKNAGADSQWHHVAIVYDRTKGGTDRSMFYLDGIAQGVYSTWTDGSTTNLRNATLFIGSRNNSSMKYVGDLDDVRITGAALQPGQFLKAPSTELPRVIAYWPFPRRLPLADATGNGHALSNTGVTFANDAAIFDGAHTAFSTKPWTLNLRPYSALTIEYFIRTTSATTNLILEHSGNFSTARGGFNAVLNEFNPGQIESGFSMPGAGTFNIDSTAARAATDGTWHHAALVYDPSRTGDDRVRFFLDHVQQGKRSSTWACDADTFFLNDVLFVGSRGNSSFKFVGELDDVRITGAALEPSEFMAKRSYYGGTVVTIQ